MLLIVSFLEEETHMNDWVTETNISDFQRKITEEKDPTKRRILEELLAREKMKRLHMDQSQR
jgi:hypothetical protein